MREATSGVDAARVAALSFGSQLDGLVAVDADGAPVHDAIIWMDRRGDEACADVAERIAPDRLYERTGTNLDGGHVAAKIAWLRREAPSVHRRARRFLLPGSYVALALSGRAAVDPSNASSTMLLDPRTRAWDDEACAAFGVRRGRAGRGAAGRRGARRSAASGPRRARPGGRHAGGVRVR